MRPINDIESAKAIGIKPCHKCTIAILKLEQDSCIQIDNNNLSYESPEEIVNNDLDYTLLKELCRGNVSQCWVIAIFSN